MTTGEEEFELSFSRPENNPYGILTLVAPAVEIDHKVVDVLTVIKPIFDICDDEKTEAVLLPDGKGIVIAEPCMPTYLFTETDSIQEQLRTEDDHCSATELAHKVASTSLIKNKHRQSKRVKLFFPDGVTCNKTVLNNENEPVIFFKESWAMGHKLKQGIHIQPYTLVEADETEGTDAVMGTTAFLYWKVAIDSNEDRSTCPEEAEKSSEPARMAAVNRMMRKMQIG